jgi:hypothetical protein
MYEKNFERKFLSLKEKFDSHIQEIQNNIKLYLKKLNSVQLIYFSSEYCKIITNFAVFLISV